MYTKIKRKIKILIKDFLYDVLKGDLDSRRRFFYKYRAHIKKLKNKISQKTKAKQYKDTKDAFKKDLFSYISEAVKLNHKDFIFLFSGTTFVQEKRGNRPIRLTNAWIMQGVPVLFSYYRWNQGEEIPKNDVRGLYQMPIDYTMEWIDELISLHIPVENKVFIVSFPYPQLARYIGKLELNGWRIVYDVRDNWEEFHKVNMAKWYEKSMEKFFVCNSHVVCCVAEPLQKKMQAYTGKKQIKLSPNALDEKFYKAMQDVKKQQLESDHITVGYVGHLSSSWFNWEALIETAKQKSDWVFEIIGHFEPKGLNIPNNIHLLGSKEHAEIKQITNRWHVAMIPFTISDLSDCVDPIKIYEYLAMQLPVVSFRMPQIHDYPNTYIAYSVKEFIEKIEEAKESIFNQKANEIFLRKNTWSIRANELLQWTRNVSLPYDIIDNNRGR